MYHAVLMRGEGKESHLEYSGNKPTETPILGRPFRYYYFNYSGGVLSLNCNQYSRKGYNRHEVSFPSSDKGANRFMLDTLKFSDDGTEFGFVLLGDTGSKKRCKRGIFLGQGYHKEEIGEWKKDIDKEITNIRQYELCLGDGLSLEKKAFKILVDNEWLKSCRSFFHIPCCDWKVRDTLLEFWQRI